MVVDGFRFLGGRLSLNFVASLTGRYRGGGEEQLARPDDLGRWFRAAGLIVEAPRVRPAELMQARELREAVYRLVRPDTRDDPRPPDIETLNLWAGQCGLRPLLGEDARSVRLVAKHPVQACLTAVAADAIDIVAGPQLAFVRECVRAECSVLFFDASRSRQRRWCDMTRCGNRSKAARHRLRNRAVPPPTR